AGIHHRDPLIDAGESVQVLGATVLFTTEVDCQYLAVQFILPIPGGATVAGPEIHHVVDRVLLNFADHMFHSAVASVCDGFVRGLIQAQVDIVPAPDLRIKRAGVFTVVGGLGNTLGFVVRQEASYVVGDCSPL